MAGLGPLLGKELLPGANGAAGALKEVELRYTIDGARK